MFGLTWSQIFGLTGFAAIIGVLGTIIGHFLKEVVFARWLETWKTHRAAKTSLSLLVAPMFQATRELLTRLHEIHDQFPPNYLAPDALKSPDPDLETNDISDPHYRHYKLVSSLYRFCAFWGWVELFRQDVVAVQSSQSKRVSEIESCLQELRSDVADGQLNHHDDWDTWRDRLVFREELRAIGECMIATPPHQGVIGYATFCDCLAQRRNADWLNVSYNFFMNLGKKKDFRRERFLRLIVHLHILLEALDRSRIPEYVSEAKRRYKLPVD